MIENTPDIQSASHANQTVTRTFSLERRAGNQAAMLTLNLTFNDLDNVAEELLKQSTQLIHHRLRGSDIIVELDGYEIILLLKDICSQDNADMITNELIELIIQPCRSVYHSNVHIHSGANTRVEISFSPL